MHAVPYLELMKRLSQKTRISPPTKSICLCFHTFHWRLSFRQPCKELVQWSIKVVKGVHCRVEQLPSVDDAVNIQYINQMRLYNCVSPKHVQSFTSMFPRCLYGTKPRYRSTSNCSFYGSCHSSLSWTFSFWQKSHEFSAKWCDRRLILSKVALKQVFSQILWFSLANLYSIIAPHLSNALLHPQPLSLWPKIWLLTKQKSSLSWVTFAWVVLMQCTVLYVATCRIQKHICCGFLQGSWIYCMWKISTFKRMLIWSTLRVQIITWTKKFVA